MKLLRIVLDGEEHPNYTITKAFESEFETETVWWQQHDNHGLNAHLQNIVRQNNYDVVFMQIQADHVIWEDTVRIMSQHALVFNWTGDVRDDLIAFTRIGQHCVSLFCGETDVKRMRSMGFRADYLQTGYDHKHYYNFNSVRQPFIVFCANNYMHHRFPLASMRTEMARRLQLEFGSRFKLFGSGWENTGIKSEGVAHNWMEAMMYNSSAIAINLSHFSHERYYSDRLLREMACGVTVLSHRFPRFDEEFIDGKHIVVWDNLSDLVDKCHYYLEHTDEARMIGEAASRFVESHCRWEHRVSEFKDIILKYKS